MGGRPPKNTDVEVLQLFIEATDPFLFTTEVAELLDMTQQGAYQRLKNLESKGYVASKSSENARGWWITHAGRDYVSVSGSDDSD